ETHEVISKLGLPFHYQDDFTNDRNRSEYMVIQIHRMTDSSHPIVIFQTFKKDPGIQKHISGH
ncbi:MAG: hypothetical protein PHD55_11730, partial [Methanoregula sp.]|nr:hypothetical protein [Methanoregula sp.]